MSLFLVWKESVKWFHNLYQKMEKWMLLIGWSLPIMLVGDEIASSAFQTLHKEIVENAF